MHLISLTSNRPLSLVHFVFSNTDHVIIHRCFGPLFCSLKRVHASMNMSACTLWLNAINHNLSFLDFFEFAESTVTTRTRANHDYKLNCKSAVCNCFKYPFLIGIVRKWNDLPSYIVHAESLSVFKSSLKIYLYIN